MRANRESVSAGGEQREKLAAVPVNDVYEPVTQGGQQTLETLEDPEKRWIFFAPGKIPRET